MQKSFLRGTAEGQNLDLGRGRGEEVGGSIMPFSINFCFLFFFTLQKNGAVDSLRESS